MPELTDAQILQLLQAHTYQEVAESTGRSKGAIFRIALANGARKTENRIRERKAERERRQIESLEAMLHTTATADVLDFLDSLPDESIDAFVSSPPYNVGKGYGGGASADVMRHTYFHGWLMQIISEMARLIKPGGVVALNIGKTTGPDGRLMPMSHMLYSVFVSAGLQFQSEVAWTIPHGLTPKKRLSERYETILIFSKGEVAHFNATAARSPQKQPGKRAYKGPNKGALSGHPFGAHPSDVWSDISNVRHNHPEKKHGDHPAQFPVALPKRIMQLYTLPGQLICDPFNGSGSTQIACIETERSFVGCDLFYPEIRERRLGSAKADNVCVLPGISDESAAVWQAEARRVDYVAGSRASEREGVM